MRSHHRVLRSPAQAVARRACLQALALAPLAALPSCRDGATSSPPPAKAIAAKQGLSSDGNPQPTGDDRCPMCAMRVIDHPDWAGAIELASGATYYTCSVRCTLATAMRSDSFLGVPPDQIKRVRVPHYLEKGKSLDADSAWYVIDSDVRGPMGLALLPAASEQEAQVLVRRHQGRVLSRKDVTLDVLKDLKQRSKGH